MALLYISYCGIFSSDSSWSLTIEKKQFWPEMFRQIIAFECKISYLCKEYVAFLVLGIIGEYDSVFKF